MEWRIAKVIEDNDLEGTRGKESFRGCDREKKLEDLGSKGYNRKGALTGVC